MLLLHVATETGQLDKVDEWGRRLTSQQVTELMAFYEARHDIIEAGRPADRSAGTAPRRRGWQEFSEAELRAHFRAHNARLGVA